MMYGFTDDSLLNALIDAKKQGKNINVLLEPHPYKATNENTFAENKLQQAHINLLTPNLDMKLTHQKTLITDDSRAVVMTFNFTHSTFTKQRNFALILDDPAEVQEIIRIFNADTHHKNISVTHPNLVWSPNNSREKILNFINHAQSEIKIYAQDISDYQMIGALAKAARSGKKVQIIMATPQENKRNRKLEYLRKAGVDIHFSKKYFTHAKVIMIDHSRALLGSINFTRYSINENRELSVITQNPTVLKQLLTTFNQDWNENFNATSIDTRHSLLQGRIKQILELVLQNVPRLKFASHNNLP